MSRISLKVALLLIAILTLILLGFSWLTITLWEESLIDAAVTDTEYFSDTIKRSTEHAMMRAQRDEVREIIHTVGLQERVEWVRILNKEGRIMFSSKPDEVGGTVDKKAEACDRCHNATAAPITGEAATPPDRLPSADRSRILLRSDGRRVLATIDPIANRPSCTAAGCHTADQRVLGVLDVAVSLEQADRILFERRVQMWTVGGAVILLVALAVFFFLQRYVGAPVHVLLKGTRKIAEGDLDVRIAYQGKDEIAHLADSFNAMTESLKKAHGDLQRWGERLEERVAEKTKELKAVQWQVIRAEKLASLGRIAAGVAHELNNPLTGVLTFAHLVRKRLPPGSQEMKDIDVIIGETNRCSKIVRDLLDYARETVSERRSQNVNDILRKTTAIIEHQAAFQDIVIAMDLNDDLPPSEVDADQMRQVCMNLICNAAEAMGNGGTLRIRTFMRPAAAGGAGDRIVLEFQDTGVGISEANVEKIFDPFFTTKEPGKGTGLGLSICLRIVENHGGTIEVESAEGRGTTVRVLLPPVKRLSIDEYP